MEDKKTAVFGIYPNVCSRRARRRPTGPGRLFKC